MARRYMYISEDGERALAAYRARYAGNWPKDGPGWALLDQHKREVIAAAVTPEVRKRIEGGYEPGVRSEYRLFLQDLTQGEPRERTVDPVPVPANVASVGFTDGHGYLNAIAARDGGSEEVGGGGEE